MKDDVTENIGRYARHPIRTAGAAFLVGVGASMVMTKMRGIKKFED